MANNEEFLNEARTQIEALELRPDSEGFREAYMALENVDLAQAADAGSRNLLRREVLELWLRLLQALDRSLDSDFDPGAIPEKLVSPPRLSGDVVLRPGADPALIEDPQTRAEYEQAIAEHRAKTEGYRLQVHLHRLEEPIMERARAFIRHSYSFAPSDREEAKTIIERTIVNPERRASLLEACYAID